MSSSEIFTFFFHLNINIISTILKVIQSLVSSQKKNLKNSNCLRLIVHSNICTWIMIALRWRIQILTFIFFVHLNIISLIYKVIHCQSLPFHHSKKISKNSKCLRLIVHSNISTWIMIAHHWRIQILTNCW